MSYFDDEFLSNIRNEPFKALIEICERKKELVAKSPDQVNWTPEEHIFMLEAHAILSEMDAGGLLRGFDGPSFAMQGEITADCKAMGAYINELADWLNGQLTKQRMEAIRKRVAAGLGTIFTYEFSQGDLDRVQVLMNELREAVRASDLFEEAHRARVLAKLEKLQAELHKKMSDMDRFWGFFAEAGVMLGKFGTDAKPMFDRVNEMISIVWQAQKRAEELPSSTPLPRIEHGPSEPPPAMEA